MTKWKSVQTASVSEEALHSDAGKRVMNNNIKRVFAYMAHLVFALMIISSAGAEVLQDKKARTESKVQRSRWKKSLGLGLTNLHYSQTLVTPFTQRFITVKGGLETLMPGSEWSLGGSFFFNSIALSNSGTYRLRILGVNLRSGRFLTSPESGIQVRLNGGVYYTTSLSEIGLKDMVGPQIFPEFSFRISQAKSVMIYFKYSPVLVAGSFDIFSNRELALGLYFRQLISNTNSWFVGVDYSELDARFGSEEASMRSLSLGAGLGF